MAAPVEPVLAAMSGGVDSSVAALLLKQRGCEVAGVSMQVWDYRRFGGCSGKAACCAPRDFLDARRVAALLDIPYYVFDFEESFRAEVVERFAAAYAAGLTPIQTIATPSPELRWRCRARLVAAVAITPLARIGSVRTVAGCCAGRS